MNQLEEYSSDGYDDSWLSQVPEESDAEEEEEEELEQEVTEAPSLKRVFGKKEQPNAAEWLQNLKETVPSDEEILMRYVPSDWDTNAKRRRFIQRLYENVFQHAEDSRFVVDTLSESLVRNNKVPSGQIPQISDIAKEMENPAGNWKSEVLIRFDMVGLVTDDVRKDLELLEVWIRLYLDFADKTDGLLVTKDDHTKQMTVAELESYIALFLVSQDKKTNLMEPNKKVSSLLVDRLDKLGRYLASLTSEKIDIEEIDKHSMTYEELESLFAAFQQNLFYWTNEEMNAAEKTSGPRSTFKEATRRLAKVAKGYYPYKKVQYNAAFEDIIADEIKDDKEQEELERQGLEQTDYALLPDPPEDEVAPNTIYSTIPVRGDDNSEDSEDLMMRKKQEQQQQLQVPAFIEPPRNNPWTPAPRPIFMVPPEDTELVEFLRSRGEDFQLVGSYNVYESKGKLSDEGVRLPPPPESNYGGLPTQMVTSGNAQEAFNRNQRTFGIKPALYNFKDTNKKRSAEIVIETSIEQRNLRKEVFMRSKKARAALFDAMLNIERSRNSGYRAHQLYFFNIDTRRDQKDVASLLFFRTLLQTFRVRGGVIYPTPKLSLVSASTVAETVYAPGSADKIAESTKDYSGKTIKRNYDAGSIFAFSRDETLTLQAFLGVGFSGDRLDLNFSLSEDQVKAVRKWYLSVMWEASKNNAQGLTQDYLNTVDADQHYLLCSAMWRIYAACNAFVREEESVGESAYNQLSRADRMKRSYFVLPPDPNVGIETTILMEAMVKLNSEANYVSTQVTRGSEYATLPEFRERGQELGEPNTRTISQEKKDQEYVDVATIFTEAPKLLRNPFKSSSSSNYTGEQMTAIEQLTDLTKKVGAGTMFIEAEAEYARDDYIAVFGKRINDLTIAINNVEYLIAEPERSLRKMLERAVKVRTSANKALARFNRQYPTQGLFQKLREAYKGPPRMSLDEIAEVVDNLNKESDRLKRWDNYWNEQMNENPDIIFAPNDIKDFERNRARLDMLASSANNIREINNEDLYKKRDDATRRAWAVWNDMRNTKDKMLKKSCDNTKKQVKEAGKDEKKRVDSLRQADTQGLFDRLRRKPKLTNKELADYTATLKDITEDLAGGDERWAKLLITRDAYPITTQEISDLENLRVAVLRRAEESKRILPQSEALKEARKEAYDVTKRTKKTVKGMLDYKCKVDKRFIESIVKAKK